MGAGLDVMHSVVGFRRLSHLVRNVEVEITDRKLVGMPAVNPVSRLAGSTAALFAFLPKQIYRGFFAPSSAECTADIPESLEQPAAALEDSGYGSSRLRPGGFGVPLQLGVVRRYGDQ